MTFDEHGHLVPPAFHELSLPEFEHFLVASMPNPEPRRLLFENYLAYVNDEKKAFGCPFFHWIDGSFVTQKEFPDDVDVVTFLPFEMLGRKNNFAQYFLQNGKTLYRVDGYFVATCRPNHYHFDDFRENEQYWRNLYGLSREDSKGNRLPKGIIKIQF